MITCSKCGSKVSVSGPCRTCEKRRKQPESGVILKSGRGSAFVSDATLERWARNAEQDADREMIGDDAANFGLSNIGNK